MVYTWKFLEKYTKTGDLGKKSLSKEKKLYRSKLIDKAYQQHKKYLKLHMKIGLSQNICDLYFQNGEDYALVPNKFQYNVAKNIAHWVLWFNPFMYTSSPKKEVVNKILEWELGDVERVWYENPKRLKTIPEIPHIQVFIKLD